jgi:hypothetical protein
MLENKIVAQFPQKNSTGEVAIQSKRSQFKSRQALELFGHETVSTCYVAKILSFVQVARTR